MISGPVATERRTSSVLSRQAVVDHALTVADADGPGAVSIRRIAHDLGVTPMALYWHVKNKDELLAAMGDRILESIPTPAVEHGEIVDLREILAALIEALRAHPGCTSLAGARILASDAGLSVAEWTLQLLRRNGFSVQQSADLARAALQAAISLVANRPGAESSLPQEERESAWEAKHSRLTTLPADRYPALVECADALMDCSDEPAYYGAGIDLFISGVQALRDQACWPGPTTVR